MKERKYISKEEGDTYNGDLSVVSYTNNSIHSVLYIVFFVRCKLCIILECLSQPLDREDKFSALKAFTLYITKWRILCGLHSHVLMQLVRPVAPNPSIEPKKLFTLTFNCQVKLKHDEVKSTHSHLAIWVKKVLHNALCWTLYILLQAKVKKRPKLKRKRKKKRKISHKGPLCHFDEQILGQKPSTKVSIIRGPLYH